MIHPKRQCLYLSHSLLYTHTHTQCIAPSEPLNVLIRTNEENSVDVRWEPPSHPNGVITHYTVSTTHIHTVPATVFLQLYPPLCSYNCTVSVLVALCTSSSIMWKQHVHSAQHMHSTCTAHAQHMYITCTAHARHMHSTCTAHAQQHMHSTCTAHAQLCYDGLTFHMYNMQ